MAYTTATLVAKDIPFDDGRTRITVEFAGAGEPTKRLAYTVGPNDSLATLRAWIDTQAANFVPAKTVADSLTIGQQVAVRAIVAPTPTAEQIWRAKVSRYQAMKDLGLVGQAATDLAALKSDIESTYLSAYL